MAPEIEGRSWWGGWGRRVHQNAVVGSQKRHTSVFSWTWSYERAAQKTPKISKTCAFTRGSLQRWLHHRLTHGFHQTFALFQEDVLHHLVLFWTTPSLCAFPICFASMIQLPFSRSFFIFPGHKNILQLWTLLIYDTSKESAKRWQTKRQRS